MSKRESPKKYWLFTFNNYTESDEAKFKELVPSFFQYVTYGKEIAPTTGTPHLQGFFILVKKNRHTALNSFFAANFSKKFWFDACKGNEDQNINYCYKPESKPEDYEIVAHGTKENCQGQRGDLDLFKAAVKDGCYDLKRLREDHSDVCAKYPRFVAEYLQDHQPLPQIPIYPLRPWQQALNQILLNEPSEREILFVIDEKGNTGKTWFAKYYCNLHENAQYMEAGKKTDMAYALNSNIRVLFVNCTRKMCDFLPYGFLESVKDGIVFSSKYESRNKILGPVHVIVLMNQEPDQQALSKDRYAPLYTDKFD